MGAAQSEALDSRDALDLITVPASVLDSHECQRVREKRQHLRFNTFRPPAVVCTVVGLVYVRDTRSRQNLIELLERARRHCLVLVADVEGARVPAESCRLDREILASRSACDHPIRNLWNRNPLRPVLVGARVAVPLFWIFPALSRVLFDNHD